MTRKILSIILSLCLVLGFIPALAAELDTSEEITLVFYTAGDEPTGKQAVQDAINEKLMEKFNAKLDFQFTSWTDYINKYTNSLIAGDVDMVYIAGWLNYQLLALQGAYLDIDDLLTEYAPKLRERAGEDMLNQCRVDGVLYAVPALWPEYVSSGISYRTDLVEKYNLPIPNSLENLEAYFEGIKTNEPDTQIYQGVGTTGTTSCTAFDIADCLMLKYDGLMSYGYEYIGEAPDKLQEYWFSDNFVEDMKMFKRWSDKGFWSKSVLSSENDVDAYKNGLRMAIVSGQNPNKHITNINNFAAEHPDWTTEYLAYGEVTGEIAPGHATQNGTAITATCKYPERAVAILEYLMMDEEMNRLIQCGIEGVHYELDENGYYHNINDEFGYEAFDTWNLRVNEYKLMQESDAYLQSIFDRYAEIGAQHKFPNINIGGGFSEDYSEYEAERTAVMNVVAQYLNPLQAGFVDDVDAAVEEFRAKLIEAGIETCREGFLEQWVAYCEEFGYVGEIEQ